MKTNTIISQPYLNYARGFSLDRITFSDKARLLEIRRVGLSGASIQGLGVHYIETSFTPPVGTAYVFATIGALHFFYEREERPVTDIGYVYRLERNGDEVVINAAFYFNDKDGDDPWGVDIDFDVFFYLDSTQE